MADKMSSKSEKLPNLPDKMWEECYGMKIIISHHLLLVFCLNKTIQTTFHYGPKWRLTVMACLITNAAFKLFKSVHTHQSCHYSPVISIKMLTLNLLKKCGTKQLRTIYLRASWKSKMADADEFQNVWWHVAQILQSILLSRIQMIFIVMYVWPNLSKKCGICILFSV